MLKVYSKKVISTIVASSLIFGLGNAVASAAPKNGAKETGRSEQNVQTGVISFDEVIVPRHANEIQLTGTVVIDGPQLKLEILGAEIKEVTKVGDKTWTYEATADVSAIKGDAEFEISAHTEYINGKNAGIIHTSARTVTQEVHVPYVTSTVAEKTEWTDYDRSRNKFTLSYNEVENWSVGDPVSTPMTLVVDGNESEVTVLGTNLEVPTANRDFKFEFLPEKDKPWHFDSNTKTYSVTFNILITDSKGDVTTKSVTKDGLKPGETNTVSHSIYDSFGEITKTHELTAPAAPVVHVVPVELRDIQLTLVPQNKNQFKVQATYTILYSDDSTKTVKDEQLEGGNIADPATEKNNKSSKDYKISGFVYTISVTYDSDNGTYHTTAVLKN